MRMLATFILCFGVLLGIAGGVAAQVRLPLQTPLFRVVDLDVGTTHEVILHGGRKVKVKLVDVHERRDPIRDAVREATVKVDIDGQRIELKSGNYRLPDAVAGVRLDCPITRGYLKNSNTDAWGLEKDARLRLWPATSPLFKPGTFMYPAKQKWFASMTQMANEPVYVDGGEKPGSRRVYYHYGLDIGGAEEMVEVVSATKGKVVSAGKKALPGFEDTPVSPRYDVIYIVDERGWFYRYSHLYRIDVKAGENVAMGQTLGLLGKEGGSGGWSHLHFEIRAKQPSGKWGIQEGYAFLWNAYVEQYRPGIIAVARPHHLAWTGEKVTLDASNSWTRTGRPRYEWKFSDGGESTSVRPTRVYDKPGMYSEILKLSDSLKQVDYDFAVVQVLDKENPKNLPPTIHAAYSPTFDIRPNTPVTFKVRTFRTTEGHEVWDFGDGTPTVKVRSDGNVKPLARDGYAVTTHRFARPGSYIVRVQRSTDAGLTATAHLHVQVDE